MLFHSIYAVCTPCTPCTQYTLSTVSKYPLVSYICSPFILYLVQLALQRPHETYLFCELRDLFF